MGAHRELSLTLTISAVLTALSGIMLLIVPGWFNATFLGYPDLPKLGMVRWSGAPVLGIALCFWLARGQTQGLRPVLALGAVGSTVYVLTVLYGYVIGETASPGPLWLYIIVYAAFAVQFWRLYVAQATAADPMDDVTDDVTRHVGMPRWR
jgi:hypothetical protein